MRNVFQVFGDTTAILLRYRDEPIVTLISTEDLQRVASINGRWYAMDVGRDKGEKIYVGTKIGGVTIYLHKFIVKNPPKTVVDHINHNPLDNRRQNLRIATRAENGQNRKGAQRNNVTSGYRNVYRNSSGNWFVRLQREGQTIHIGTFGNVEEANRQAIIARKKYFGVGAK